MLRLLLFTLTLATATVAAVPPPPAPIEEASITTLQRDLDRAERNKAIAEAKAEVIAAGRDKLAIDVNVFGILMTFLVLGFGFATYNQAAVLAGNAARNELRASKEEIEALMARAKAASDEAVITNESLQKKINSPPNSTPQTLPAEEQLQLDAAVAKARATPRAQLTAEQYKLLMFDAEQKGDWVTLRQLAEAMAFIFNDKSNERALALFSRAFALQELGDHQAAGSAYSDYIAQCPDDHPADQAGALSNWGNVLSSLAKTKTGIEADSLFAEAGTKFAEAVRIKPDLHGAFNNWGASLSDQAKTKSGAESDALFAEAGTKYAEAVRIKPEMYRAFSNWGNALAERARNKSGAEADTLFAEASAKYAEAVRIKPDMHEAFNNWGNALSDQAKTKSGAESDALFAEAGTKFAEAVRIMPEKHETFSNWGAMLSDQAKTKSGADADVLFAKASVKCAEADRIKPGTGAYNLACIAGLRGDAELAANLLTAAHDHDPHFPNCAHINTDVDFAAVRAHPSFQAALREIGCGPAEA
jgi:tetratricopeptide (TPR) repeat protein